jgi:hypothetical protein
MGGRDRRKGRDWREEGGRNKGRDREKEKRGDGEKGANDIPLPGLLHHFLVSYLLIVELIKHSGDISCPTPFRQSKSGIISCKSGLWNIFLDHECDRRRTQKWK